MKNAIDRKEAVTLLFFIAIPQLIINYISFGMSKHNSGYWINFIICSVLALLLIVPVKSSLNKKLNVYTENSITEKVTDIVFIVYILSLTLYNFNICTTAMFSVTSKTFTQDINSFLPLISAVICSAVGIEAISRTSYVIFYFALGIILFICLITFNGWDTGNFYPILGNSAKSTFLDFRSLGVFSSLLSVYMLRSNLAEPKKSFLLIKKTLLYVVLFGIGLTVICILNVPYPMINHYNFSMEAIFSVAKSNVFFHRFELIMVFLLMIINTMSLSLGLFLLSKAISNITKSHDAKPFSYLLGGVIFYLNLLINNFKGILYAYIISSILLYICLLIKSVVVCFSGKKLKRVRH